MLPSVTRQIDYVNLWNANTLNQSCRKFVLEFDKIIYFFVTQSKKGPIKKKKIIKIYSF